MRRAGCVTPVTPSGTPHAPTPAPPLDPASHLLKTLPPDCYCDVARWREAPCCCWRRGLLLPGLLLLLLRVRGAG
jgi:hypothetical protein